MVAMKSQMSSIVRGLASMIGKPGWRRIYVHQTEMNKTRGGGDTENHALPFSLQLSHSSHTQVCRHLLTINKDTMGFSSGEKQNEKSSSDLNRTMCKTLETASATSKSRNTRLFLAMLPVYILRVLSAGTKVTASGRFWSGLPLLWRNFCRCLSS